LRELTVIDLFAGIGGFSYGLHNASPMFKTVAFAEIDEFCQKVLKKNFGNVKIYEDVRDVRIEQPVFLVCGGFPCQGFSVAGLQRGTKDNRYLWPEMFDVIKYTKPKWVIAENVRGIVNVEDGMAFDKVHTDLESYGYEVQAFCIPASAKGAWHRRERIWFVACNPDVVYPHDFRCEQHTEAEEKGNGRAEATSLSGSSYDVSDSGSKRLKSSRVTGKMGSKSKEEEGRRNQSSFLSTSSSNVPNSESKGLSGRRGEESYQNENRMEQGEERQQGKVRSLLERCDGISNDVPDSESIGHGGGNSKERGTEQRKFQQKEQTRNEMGSETEGCGELSREGENATNSDSEGLSLPKIAGNNGKNKTKSNDEHSWGRSSIYDRENISGDWSEIIAQFRGVPDGVSTELDKTRTNRIKSLGNSIVPQIAEEIGRAIIKAESKQ